MRNPIPTKSTPPYPWQFELPQVELTDCTVRFDCRELGPGTGVLFEFDWPLLDPAYDALIDELDRRYQIKTHKNYGRPRADLLYLARKDLAEQQDPNQQLLLAQSAARAVAHLTRRPEACRILQIVAVDGSTITAQPTPWQQVDSKGKPSFEVGRYDYSLADLAYEFLNGYPIDLDEIDPDEIGLDEQGVADEVMTFTPLEVEQMIETATDQLGLVDDQSGLDETTLLCRAALEIIEHRHAHH